MASTPVEALLVDARPVDHPTARQRGIGRYVTGLLRGLVEIGAPVVALHGSDVEAEVLADAVPGLPLRPWGPPVVREHARPGTWYLATQLMLHPIPLDPVPSVVTRARLPVAAVMYDVIPYRFPDLYQVEPNARRQAQLRAPLARTLDAMLAISRFSATTAAEELAFPLDRTRVIGAGVEPQFVPASVDARPRPDRVLPAGVDDYVVAVTGGDERKNTEGLLRAWGRLDAGLRRRLRLVIATAHAPAVLRRWQRWASEAGVLDEVVFTGAVTDDEMVAILQRARLAVMPSIEEGFGLPVVEAAACGCPVICSDVSSLPEVLEEPAAGFDPFEPDSIASAIERGLTDDAHRTTLLAAGERAAQRWTWTRVATDTMAALTELGPRWTQRPRPPDRRIAIVGPFAGSESGIGRYDEALVGALRRIPDAPRVDLLVDGSGTPEPTRAGPGRFPARALGRYVKPWDVDHVVAVLGSSHHHVATAQLAASVPCHVWLHEASLVGVHVGLAHASGSERWAVDHVAAQIRADADAALAEILTDAELLDATRLDRLGITLLADTLARARSVIVSSDRAAEIVRRVRPTGPPLLVLPHAHHPVRAPAGPPDGAEIVAVGWLAANKAPLVAIDVLARLAPRHDVSLTFVGPTFGGVVDEIRDAAALAGVDHRVAFTGRLDDEAFMARIGRARVGLQLRTTERGEMSGAVADLLACGVPVVTTLSTADGPGVRLVRSDPDELVAAIEPLLTDDTAWRVASAAALERAAAWTFDDVAAALLRWLDDLEGGEGREPLGPTTVRR